jgi:hypothetical protein
MTTRILAPLLLPAALIGQNEGFSGGPFLGAPAALTVGAQIGATGAPGTIYRSSTMTKPNGFGTAVPAPSWPALRNLDLAQIFGNLGLTTAQVAAIDTDDLSMGEDWVLADSSGRVSLPMGVWAAITFSVTVRSQGEVNSRLRRESTNGTVGADVFSYVLPGSALPAAVVGSVERAQDSLEMGLPAGTEVDGLDTLASLRNQAQDLGSYLATTDDIYFTLSSASAALPTVLPWFAPFIPSGASILRTRRIGVTWTMPTVWMNHTDLGLAPTDDIDGLAIDKAGRKLLFSLRGGSLDQIMFFSWPAGSFPLLPVPPVPYTQSDGTTLVSTSIGLLQDDDLDAICSMDPVTRGAVGGSNPLWFCLGATRPTATAFAPPVPLWASAFRDHGALPPGPAFDTWMVGWPPATGAGPGLAALAVTLDDTLAPVFTLSLQVRDTTSLNGDPRHFRWQLPPTTSLTGLGLTFRWFAFATGSGEIAEAWPVKVRL